MSLLDDRSAGRWRFAHFLPKKSEALANLGHPWPAWPTQQFSQAARSDPCRLVSSPPKVISQSANLSHDKSFTSLVLHVNVNQLDLGLIIP
jgi:hypothetical protein